jgi:hypothetical protein
LEYKLCLKCEGEIERFWKWSVLFVKKSLVEKLPLEKKITVLTSIITKSTVWIAGKNKPKAPLLDIPEEY